MRDLEILQEVKYELCRIKDRLVALPGLEEMGVYEYLNDMNKNKLEKVYDFIIDAYGSLDICVSVVGAIIERPQD